METQLWKFRVVSRNISLYFFLTFQLISFAAICEVTVLPVEGTAPAERLEEIRQEMLGVLEGTSGEFETSAELQGFVEIDNGPWTVTLTLTSTDGSQSVTETRTVTAASAMAQIRAMTRSLETSLRAALEPPAPAPRNEPTTEAASAQPVPFPPTTSPRVQYNRARVMLIVGGAVAVFGIGLGAMGAAVQMIKLAALQGRHDRCTKEEEPSKRTECFLFGMGRNVESSEYAHAALVGGAVALGGILIGGPFALAGLIRMKKLKPLLKRKSKNSEFALQVTPWVSESDHLGLTFHASF